jgi:hypothetical protein
MASKTSSIRRRATATTKTAAAKQSRIEIVVRRGAIRRFDALKTRTSELPVVLTWDRRTDDRRDRGASASLKRDRRESERRKAPPFTWDLADFVVVERGGRRKKAGKKPSKKS